MLVFEAMHEVDLLARVQVGEYFAVDRATALINTGESLTICLLQVLKGAAQLTVDVVDNARPGRAGVLIGRDDLVRESGKRASLIHGEESPWRAVPVAGHAGAARGCRG